MFDNIGTPPRYPIGAASVVKVLVVVMPLVLVLRLVPRLVLRLVLYLVLPPKLPLVLALEKVEMVVVNKIIAGRCKSPSLNSFTNLIILLYRIYRSKASLLD